MKQVRAAGLLNKILAIVLISLASINLHSDITNNEDISRILAMSVPFFILAIIIIFLKQNMAISLCCFIAGLYSILNQNVVGDYSASILFIFSFHASRKNIFGIILISITVICVSINATIIHADINTTVNLLIAYAVVYIIYYVLIHSEIISLKNKIKELEKELEESRKQEPKPIIRNIDLLDIKEEEKAIIKLYCNGMSYGNINKFLGINNANDTIRRKITTIKKDNNKNNDAEFGKWLFESV